MDEWLLAFLSEELLGAVGGAAYLADSETGAVGIGEDADDVVGLERAFDAGDAYGEDGGSLLAEEGTHGSLVEVDGTFGEVFGVGNPLLDVGDFVLVGYEACAAHLGSNLVAACFRIDVDEFEQYAGALAVGDDDLDAFGGYLACDALLGDHAAASETRLAGLNVLADVGIVADDGDELRVGVGGVACVDAVDVAEQDEQVGRHHGGDETRELVVVGEHQFGDRYGVVLVDDGHHALLQHHLHTVLLIEVMPARAERLLGGEYLPAGNAMIAEEFVVLVDEFGLTDSGIELALIDGIEPVGGESALEFAASAGYSSRRDEDDLYALAMKLCHLIDDGRHTCDIERAIGTGEDVGTYFDGDSIE